MQQTSIDTTQPEDTADDAEAADSPVAVAATAPAAVPRRPWPADLPTQVRAVAEVLASSPAPLAEAALADRFTGRGPWKKRLPQILQTLEAVGRAHAEPSNDGAAARWRAA